MVLWGQPINPVLRHAVPAVTGVLGLLAGVFLIMGFVLDAGQARALQQSLQQLHVVFEQGRYSSEPAPLSASQAANARAGRERR